MRNKLFFLLLLTFSQLSFVEADSFMARVIGIKDGDTIEVLYQGKPLIIRLQNVDCPEKNQAFGSKARAFTSKLCMGKQVMVIGHERDFFKRLLATVMVNNQNLNELLVQAGMAWHFTKYDQSARLATMEKEARSKKMGLWADPKPSPPWEFRKSKKLLRA